ncbi:peptide-methionine (S)-S-oxide reductase MsrA [Undibacterium sp.]|jgi:peptide-methionine (S)-S-oxide reductase|uniref:peptide-methionine (S)-S-oxide reductase MsrA n=1 Tax=Undibacterium sp. TaxID=1914977 RepID=UPI002BA099AD|nr:peptide-methionine (S)-S-oxide reductase MsrA [Undibacterium sp.]HTD06173.1 peptide-methionine (S)-S-oxide reductase MsrA [Undibacterium sp.]
MATELATLGGGCFWCTEAVFQQIRGVKSVESGYSGGHVPDPDYEQVCDGGTGHAEVIRVTFDPALVSYRELLEIFFTIHDPTTLNRQGNDVGTQYRSVIYHHTLEQQAMALQMMGEMGKLWDAPIVTELAAAPTFYPAEDYHRNYFKMNGQQRYCALVVAPKVMKARKHFAGKLVA